MYFVYALYDKISKRFYIGSTNDLERRLREHLYGKTQTTSRMTSIKLVYYEASLSKMDALKREKQLKTGFGRAYIKRRINFYLTKE